MIQLPPDDPRCTADSKQSGERCKQWSVRGKVVCKWHGGRSRPGIASATFKHGRYSKSLTAEVLQHYREAVVDPDILALQDEIALIDSRIRSIPGDTAPVAEWVEGLREATKRKDLALADGDLHKVGTAARTVRELVDCGGDDAARWAEVANLVKQRRKLADSERKRLVEARQMVSVDEARAVVARLVEGVRAEVTDADLLARIAAHFDRALGP